MIDWERPSNEDRQLLYRVIKRFLDRNRLSSDAILKPAYQGHIVGNSDFSNLGKGTLDKSKTYWIYSWMLKNHPKVIGELNMILMERLEVEEEKKNISLLKSARLKSSMYTRNQITWEGLVLKNGVFGFVEVHPKTPRSHRHEMPKELFPLPLKNPDMEGVAQSAHPAGVKDHDPLFSTTIQLNEEFYFKLKAANDAFVLGFQRIGPQWEPLILRGNAPFATIMQGQIELPQNADGSTMALVESEQARRHKFVFVLSASDLISNFGKQIANNWQIDEQVMNEFAKHLKAMKTPWQILRIDVMFIK